MTDVVVKLIFISIMNRSIVYIRKKNMNTEISKHFSAQLQDWIDAIYFDLGLSSRLSDRLEEVIRRNTIVGIADKVEVYQNQLHDVERKLYIIEEKINQQKSLISNDGIEFDNAEIDQNTRHQQMQLSRKMKRVENEFIRAKFDCNTFLSEVFTA